MKIHNPFRVAFVATLGVGLGIVLIDSIQTLSTILLYVGTALFLSLGLEPVVAWLERRKLKRWLAVLVTIIGVLALFAGVILIVLPVIIEQISQLVETIQEFAFSRSFGAGVALQPRMRDFHSSSERHIAGFEPMTNPLHSGKPQASSASFTERAKGSRRSRTASAGAPSCETKTTPLSWSVLKVCSKRPSLPNASQHQLIPCH